MINNWFKKIATKDLIIISALLLLNLLPRLIYIFSNGFFIDGDEAILGTVIQDIFKNNHFSLFLSGQNYGFVFMEVLMGSIVSLFLGVNMLSLKITIFIFWLINLVILYYIGKKVFLSRKFAFLAVLLISFIPAWYDWATKARFGYVSALLFSDLVILLTLLKKTKVRIIAISLSLLIIYYVQPLYLVVTVPFVVYYFFKDFKFKDALLFAIGSLMLLVVSRFLLLSIGFNYQVQNKLGFSEIARNLKNIFQHYSVAYSGNFFDGVRLKDHYLSSLDSQIFIVILLLVIIYDFYLILKNKIEKINILFLVSVLLYIFFMLFYNGEDYQYRYLLPFFVPSSFLIVIALEQLPKLKLKKYLYIFLTIYAIFSLICGIIFYKYVFPDLVDGYTEVERIELLGGFLNAHDIKCVYALDWIISQHINYFIPNVIVRHQEIDPRRPQDSNLVDSYQQANGCALVGFQFQMPTFISLYELNDIYVLSNRYVVHLNTSREDLLKLNFKLTN